MVDTRLCDSSGCRNKIRPFLILLDQCRGHPSSVDVSWIMEYYQHTGNVHPGRHWRTYLFEEEENRHECYEQHRSIDKSGCCVGILLEECVVPIFLRICTRKVGQLASHKWTQEGGQSGSHSGHDKCSGQESVRQYPLVSLGTITRIANIKKDKRWNFAYFVSPTISVITVLAVATLPLKIPSRPHRSTS